MKVRRIQLNSGNETSFELLDDEGRPARSDGPDVRAGSCGGQPAYVPFLPCAACFSGSCGSLSSAARLCRVSWDAPHHS
jgi:hypothetical protein